MQFPASGEWADNRTFCRKGGYRKHIMANLLAKELYVEQKGRSSTISCDKATPMEDLRSSRIEHAEWEERNRCDPIGLRFKLRPLSGEDLLLFLLQVILSLSSSNSFQWARRFYYTIQLSSNDNKAMGRRPFSTHTNPFKNKRCGGTL